MAITITKEIKRRCKEHRKEMLMEKAEEDIRKDYNLKPSINVMFIQDIAGQIIGVTFTNSGYVKISSENKPNFININLADYGLEEFMAP